MGSFQQGLRSWLLGAVLFTLTASAGVYLASCGDDSSKRKPADASVGAAACVPAASQEYVCANLPECATTDDGCNAIQCPCIDTSKQCNADNICVVGGDCTAKTPEQACGNRQCGTAALGCGKGTVTCGNNGGGCPDGQTCSNGQCSGGGGGGCPGSATCAGRNCGDLNSCGTGTCSGPCSGGMTCNGSNQCVPPDTCDMSCAGKACGELNGCGQKCSGSCTGSYVCNGNYQCVVQCNDKLSACGVTSYDDLANTCGVVYLNNCTYHCSSAGNGKCPTGKFCSVPQGPSNHGTCSSCPGTGSCNSDGFDNCPGVCTGQQTCNYSTATCGS